MSANTPEELHAVAAQAMAAPREVLTLRLGGEEYGIDILRGVIVPIVDLRCRFGLDAAYNTDTVTVVLGVGGRTVGAVVDSVSDVAALTA